MNLNLARLFSSYRLLEQQLADERDRHAKAEEALRADLVEERNERRRLQDRVLSKAGVLPVFETPPKRADGPPVVHRQTGAKEKAVVEGQKRANTLFTQISAEVEQFVADQQKENGQGAAASAGTGPGDN